MWVSSTRTAFRNSNEVSVVVSEAHQMAELSLISGARIAACHQK
jgi:hypothetical protein